MATYYIWWLHLGDLFKSPNLNDLLQELQQSWHHIYQYLNRLNELQFFFQTVELLLKQEMLQGHICPHGGKFSFSVEAKPVWSK